MKSLNALGGFTENGYYSGDGLVDMIDGYATSATQQPVMNYPAFRSWEPGGYIQDSWRALQWLTVNLGVRYDFFSPFTDKHGAISNFNQTLGVLQSPALLGLYQGTNTGDVLPDYSNIQPRLGFSASLKHQIVVRGGLGFTAFSNEIGPGTDTQMGNPPFVFTATYGDSNGSFYPVPYQMQIPAAQALGTIAAPAPCSATTYTVNCMLNLTAGLEEPFVNPATAGPTFLQG